MVQLRLSIYVFIFILSLSHLNAQCVVETSGTWTSQGNAFNTASMGNIEVSLTSIDPGFSIVNFNTSQTLTNTDPSWFSENVSGNPSLELEMVWDLFAGNELEDIDNVNDNKQTGIIKFDFSEPVNCVTIHIEKIGGVGAAVNASTGVSNSVQWTVTTPGITLQEASGSGTDDFTVSPTQVFKIFDVPDVIVNAEATNEITTGTAAGSMELMSDSPITTVEFEWTGVGVEGKGRDKLEIVVTAKSAVNPNCTGPDYDALVALYNATDGPNWTNTWDTNDCDYCDWYGVLCDSNEKVIHLYFYSNQLSGQIPSQIGDLTSLSHLDLASNQLSGSIPVQMENLTSLTYLALSNNQLSGNIPTQIGNLVNLKSLYLSNNQFSGQIPSEIGNIISLLELRLNLNQLSGQIPSEIGSLTNLLSLTMSSNLLSGSIPNEIGNLTKLTRLSLSENQLSGNIPIEIGNLNRLETIVLNRNQLSGNIPSQIENLTRLKLLYLNDNKLNGNIPTEIAHLVNLSALSLSDNELTGSIPTQIGDLKSLQTLLLDQNKLTGQIPVQIEKLIKLKTLWLSDNQLTGNILPQLGNLIFLEQLILWNNQLTGTIPTEIGNLLNLHTLSISSNQLSGCYPLSLLSTPLDLCQFTNSAMSYGNNFHAPWQDFCSSYAGACPSPCIQPDYNGLLALYNATNGANWTNTWDISDCDICNWYGITCHPNGRVKTLSLPHNNLSGVLPEDIKLLRQVEVIQFQNNQLHGPIPVSIGNLSDLEYLSLKSNQLTSDIPSGIGNMTDLNFLYLQQNQLTGSIPRSFSQLNNLISFDISQNDLSGCFHPSLTQSLCGFSNASINSGNEFDTDWSDACSCGAGTCPCENINEWIGDSGNWEWSFQWSLDHVPLDCEIVVIPNSDDVVTFPENYQSSIYTLEVSGDAQLIIPESSELIVLTDKQFVIEDGCN